MERDLAELKAVLPKKGKQMATSAVSSVTLNDKKPILFLTI